MRIEDIAAQYIQEMRQVQPEGPYFLGGTCIGGVVAFEMAQQLHARGQQVALLTLMETWPPSSLRVPRFTIPFCLRPPLFFLIGTVGHARRMLQRNPTQWLPYLREGVRVVREMVAYGDVYRGDRAVLYRNKVSEANRKAAAHYVPKPFSGRLELILASKRPVNPPQDTRLDWCTLVLGGHSVDHVPAENSGRLFVTPHVEVLAEKLKILLREAQVRD